MLIEVSEYDKCHMISLMHEISKQNKLINKTKLEIQRGFPGSSVGTESVCNAGDIGWEDPMDRGAWRATVHGVIKSQNDWRDWAHTNTSNVTDKDGAAHNKWANCKLPKGHLSCRGWCVCVPCACHWPKPDKWQSGGCGYYAPQPDSCLSILRA